MAWLASYVYYVTQRWWPSEEKCISTICYLYDETKGHSSAGLPIDATGSYRSILIYCIPVVFNRGERACPGGVNKFPGGREPLRALQHGKFYQRIY